MRFFEAVGVFALIALTVYVPVSRGVRRAARRKAAALAEAENWQTLKQSSSSLSATWREKHADTPPDDPAP